MEKKTQRNHRLFTERVFGKKIRKMNSFRKFETSIPRSVKINQIVLLLHPAELNKIQLNQI